MSKKHILYDKTELILAVQFGNNWTTIPVTANKIKRIQFDKCEEKKLFKKIDSEKISIEISSAPQPVTYFKSKEKQFFDSYKTDLEKFAKDNHITFVDNTK